MGADQVAAIRPAIAELVAAAEAREPGFQDLCASFSVPGNSDAWAQVTLGRVNLNYPRTELPLAFFASRALSLPELRVVSFHPRSYVTLAHGSCPPSIVARFVDGALAALHGLQPETYEVNVAMERL